MSADVRMEYRATWTSHLGRHEVVASSIQEVQHNVAGFQYPKPDLEVYERTVTTSEWVPLS